MHIWSLWWNSWLLIVKRIELNYHYIFIIVSVLTLLFSYLLIDYVLELVLDVKSKKDLVILDTNCFSWFFLSSFWIISLFYAPFKLWRYFRSIKIKVKLISVWFIGVFLIVTVGPDVLGGYIEKHGYKRCIGHPQEWSTFRRYIHVYHYQSCPKELTTKPK